jgi:hypothetical protein
MTLEQIKERQAARRDWVEDAEDGIGRCRHCGWLQNGQPRHSPDCSANEAWIELDLDWLIANWSMRTEQAG